MKKVTLKEKDIIVTILVSAFKDITIKNSISFIVKQDHKKLKRLKVLMEYLFITTLSSGEIFINDKENCCILLQDSGKKKTTLKTILWDIKLALYCIGIENVIKVIKREMILKKHHCKDHHIHPIIMGVKKEYQGLGYGVRLIVELVKHYKDNELPVIIETTTLENIKLYNRFGFKIFKTTANLDYDLTFLKLNKLRV